MRREKAMNEARKALDWAGMAVAALDPSMLHVRRAVHKDEEVCAMCGKFCAVKMLRETKIAPAGR
jgi:phosphomethylpyrimidine synthase